MAEKIPSIRVRIPLARISFSQVVDAKAYEENGKVMGDPKFSADLLVANEDVESIQWGDDWANIGRISTPLTELTKEFFKVKPEDISRLVNDEAIRWPVKSGDEKADELAEREKDGEFYRNTTIIRVTGSVKFPPGLFRREANKDLPKQFNRSDELELIEARKLFASGNYVSLVGNLKPYNKMNKGISFYVNNVLFIKQGEPLAVGSGASSFDGLGGGSAPVDPVNEAPTDDFKF